MIDWLIRLFQRSPGSPSDDVALTDPTEKRERDRRTQEAEARSRLLEAQARVLARAEDREPA